MTNLRVVLDCFWQSIFECNFVFLAHEIHVISDVFVDNLPQGFDTHRLVWILTVMQIFEFVFNGKVG